MDRARLRCKRGAWVLVLLAAMAGSVGASGVVRVVRPRAARPPSSRRYVPLDDVAQELDAGITHDPLSGIYVMSKGRDRLAVAPGIAAASVGSEFYLLSSPVLVHYGRAYVPREVATRARKTFGKPAVKPPVKPPKSLHYLQRVCLDPGHGGRDPGAGRNGVYEEDVVIPVAKLLGEELRRRGFDVVFTRTTDVAVELAERPAIAAKAGADLFISIHANASANASVRGIEILYIDGAKYKTTERADQANRAGRRPGPEDVGEGVMLDAAANQAVLDMLFEEFRREGIEVAESLRLAFKAAGLTVRSVRAQNLNVLRNAEMPAVLVELGFLTNASERKLLTQRWYQEKLARTMADGILAYRKKLEQTRGFSN